MSAGKNWVVKARKPRRVSGEVKSLYGADELAGYLSDAAHYPGGNSGEICFPTDESGVAAVLERSATVLTVGAQSSLTGGATPFGETLLSTSRMGGISKWGADSVEVGPGLVLAELETALRERDLYYPPLPTFDGATVGGTVATNAAGAATFKYGSTRSWVGSLTVVLADGDVLELHRGEVCANQEGRFEIVGTDGRTRTVEIPAYRMPEVPKHSAGYHAEPGMDLLDLFIGSEGTLGVVTSVELRLLTPRPAWFVAFIPVADEPAALALVAELRRASLETRGGAEPQGIDVAAVEYLDRRCLEVLAADDAYARAGIEEPADAGAAILFQSELPSGTGREEVMDQLSRLNDTDADTPLLRLCRLLEAHGLFADVIPALPGETARRDALFSLREAVPEAVNRRVREAQRDIDPSISKSGGDVIVPFERMAESLERYRRVLDEAGLDHAIWGHISDGNFHPNIIARSGEEMARAREAQLEMGRIAIELGGSPMSEHGTGRSPVKQELLLSLYGEDGVAEMRAVKAALDPSGKLAPGVMFSPASPSSSH